ncbi:MAG TPA: type II CAAX endopeptidase family protein [Alloiococcus sp.]|nr:type II CAAX endopeptidase family protein [Alloiococcus sp.]
MENRKSNLKGSIFIIITFLAVQIFGALAVLALTNFAPSIAISAMVGVNVLGVFVALWINNRYNIVYDFERNPSSISQIIKWGLLGMALAYLSQVAIVFIEILIFGEPSVSANTESIMQVVSGEPIFLLLPIFTAPFIEEFVFRKAINGILVDKIGWIGGAVISSLLFAFVHFDGMILTYAMMGLVFSYVYYKTNSIWTPILAHMGMNLLATILNLMM